MLITLLSVSLLPVLNQWTLDFHITSNKVVDLSVPLSHVTCLKRAELVLLSSPSYIITKR